MFGDATLDCLKVDAIRSRSNALIHNNFPLPVASIIDEPMPYDDELAKHPNDLHDFADFITSTLANLSMIRAKRCLIQDQIGIGTRTHSTFWALEDRN